MSLQDDIAELAREVPGMLETTGLLYHAVTSPPGAARPTYANPVPLVGFLQEVNRRQGEDNGRQQRKMYRTANLLVSDQTPLLEGSAVSVNGAAPWWSVNGQNAPHRVATGVITYSLVRDELLHLDASRGGGR